MSAWFARPRGLWLPVVIALSFTLAGCASQEGSVSETPGAGSAASRGSGAKQSGASAGEQGQAASSAAAAGGSEQAKPEPQRAATDRTALGDRVEIRQSWVQVRSTPNADARAIALAFGNDTYPVVEKQGDWVRVKLDGRREGWIPLDSTGSR